MAETPITFENGKRGESNLTTEGILNFLLYTIKMPAMRSR